MSRPASARAETIRESIKTDAEWRAILSEEQFAVLREEATERPGSSPLNDEKRKGIFHCAGCDLAAYSSEDKFESGTGWPSFWQSLPDAIGTREDNSLFSPARRCIAGVAADISAISSTTARRRPASAIA